jgi:hypothetical protein
LKCSSKYSLQPGKKSSVPKHVPAILERLNLSAELWLNTVEQFGKRRSANRITPASRFNASAQLPTNLVLRR